MLFSSCARDNMNNPVYDSEEDNPLQAIHDTLNSIHDILSVTECTPSFQSALYHLKNISLGLLGIDENYVHKLVSGQCVSIVETHKFEIAAFLLPKGFVIHLHDHPNMFVCSKLLMGSANIRSFSKSSDVNSNYNNINEFQANLELDVDKTDQDPAWFLTPSKGNFHEITALTNCAMIDILLPPYDDINRPCTFYSAFKSSQLGNNNSWILKALPPQLQHRVILPHAIPYLGYVPQASTVSPTTSSETSSLK